MSAKLKTNAIIANHQGLSHEAVNERISKGDVLPTDLAPVFTHARPREIRYMRWGLIPGFTTDPKTVAPMYNARAETLTELASFKNLIMTSRCLILNEGFYEFEKQGDERIQWKISPTQEDYFYKAGLWTTWRNHKSGEIIESFTMITCDPKNTAISSIHNRMPIIMTQPERRLWMNPNATKEQLLALLKPCDASMYSIAEFDRKPLKEKRPPKGNQSGNFTLL